MKSRISDSVITSAANTKLADGSSLNKNWFGFSVYGKREIVFSTLFWGVLIAILAVTIPYLVSIPLAGLALTLYFFRDPYREIPTETDVLLAPADGTIVELREVEENEFLKCRVLKVGIFLSVFNVHVNRAPCQAMVENVSYRKGRFHNALKEKSGVENESNSIMLCTKERHGILLRQIAGALARRIVCTCRVGETLQAGQKIGMIKLGSRTELYIPVDSGFTLQVQLKDKVKGGESILGRFQGV